MLCLNSPALGPSCGFSPVWCHIDVDLVGSHPMLDVYTLFQFAWAQLQFMDVKTNKNVCRNLRPRVCLYMYILKGRRTLFDTHVCEHAYTQQQVVEEQKTVWTLVIGYLRHWSSDKTSRLPVQRLQPRGAKRLASQTLLSKQQRPLQFDFIQSFILPKKYTTVKLSGS